MRGGRPGGWVLFAAMRAARLAILLVGIALVAFLLAKASPIDPVDAYLGGRIAQIGPEQRALIAERWGLDQPPAAQFTTWLGNIVTGDLGWSRLYNAPVADVVWSRFQASALLLGMAWLLSGLFGFALGVLAGAYEGSLLDRVIRIYCFVLAATPTFWIAIVLLIVFAVSLGWAPVCCAGPPGVTPAELGWADRARHLVLPTLALAILGVAQVALHTRAKMIEIMRSDFALYATAQGASRLEVAVRHGARNAALPALTILFASLGELFGGSVLAEQVFAYPGLGRATIEAGLGGDLPLLLAIALFTALFVGIGNLVADLLYRVVDPRMAPDGGAP